MMKKTILLLLVCLSNGWRKANHWTPDDSMYEDNMTLTGVIQINGVEQSSTTLEVGVFCGEECRGTGKPTYFFPTQRYVVQLLIFGEAGDQLTFKLYDHALGQELDLISPDAVTFTTNGYGTLGNPYVLNFEANTITQTIELSQGWNWFSTNVEITLDDLKAAIQAALPGTTATATIMSKQASVKYTRGRWTGQLNAFDQTQMYMITVSSPCEITLEGMSVDPTTLSVTIVPGANWIGFPLGENKTISSTFAGFAVNGDVVKSKTNSVRYFNGQWRGSFDTLETGQGYIYISNSVEDRVFTFPASAK